MWKTVKLGELFKVGSSKRVLKADWRDDGVPFYRGREITTLSAVGFVNNELFITEEHYRQLSEKSGVPTAGDIMITAIGTIGNTYIVEPNHKFYFKDASVLWLKKETEVSSEYIQYWLKTDDFYSQLDKGNGATVDTLSIKKLASVELSLPPLSEQQRIVAKLDAAFAEIDRAILFAQDALDNGSHLRERTFEALFTKVGEQYGVIQLGDGIELISGQHIAAKDYNSEGVGMGYLTGPSDFGSINPVVTKFTTSPKKTAQKGDVLVTIKGSGIGKANIMVEQELAISRQLAAIRPVAFTSEFVFEFVKIQFEKLQSLGNGAAIPGLSREDIEKLEIPSPPLDLQGGILEQAMSSASQVAQYEQCQIEKLKNLYQLKSAILAQELQPPQSEAA